MKSSMYVVCGMVAVLVLSGCATMDRTGMTEQEKGAVTGAAIGTALGAVVGNQTGHSGEGALIGGLLGGFGGHSYGGQQQQMNSRMQQLEQQANTEVVHVNNDNGSVTPVVLRKVGLNWQGPRGEIYQTLPTEEQLEPIYGLR